MDEGIGVRLQCVATVPLRFRSAAEAALAVFPFVLYSAEADVPLLVAEAHNGVLAVRELRAVETSAGEEARKLRYREAKELLAEDVVEARLQIGNFPLKPLDQAFGDFPKEHAALARRV